MRKSPPFFLKGMASVTSAHPSHLTAHSQPRQTDVAHSVYTVVVLILWFVRQVPVLILCPLIRLDIAYQSP